MASARALTGGTRDVNPQYMILQFTPAAAGTTQSVPFIMPLNRVAQTASRTTVMEVLKVFWYIPDMPAIANANETSYQYVGAIGTQDSGATNVHGATPSVFAFVRVEVDGAFTATGTYHDNQHNPIVHDLTDGAGHGILVATDTIYGQLQGSATFATTFRARILYRAKNVSLTEYIGIVQSQQ